MSVLIGCSGGSGSSLLRTVLNRHAAIFSGEELSLFNKERCYGDWQTVKYRLLPGAAGRLDTDGWFKEPHCYLLHQDFGWQEKELRELLDNSNSIVDFAEGFFARPVEQSGATLWVEKSPSNVYGFRLFLKTFPRGKVVHLCRNPLDTVASLVNRGFSTFHAAGRWIYDNAAGLSIADSPRYLRVFYEDFVKCPEEAVALVTDFLGVGHDPRIIEPSEHEDRNHTRNPGWKHERTGKISTESVGRFAQLTADRQLEIVTCLSLLQVTDHHADEKGMPYRGCKEICQILGYPFEANVSRQASRQTRWWLAKDYVRWAVRSKGASLLNYPMRCFNP